MLDSPMIPQSHTGAVQLVLHAVSPTRLAELGLDSTSLAAWADIAFGFSNMAVDYVPRGSMPSIDVFHAIPLKMAGSREDWVENYLSKWSSFCSGEMRFHQVQGEHYTMLGREYVSSFSEILKRALRERGV